MGRTYLQLDQALDGIRHALRGLRQLAIGATAAGAGLNAPARFGDLAARKIAEETGYPFNCAGNQYAGISTHHAVVALCAPRCALWRER